jgi:hypothetical protein
MEVPMRFTVLACALLAPFTLHAAGVTQDRPEAGSKLPEKGDTITVKGCISGSTIEGQESGLIYRIKGDKGLITHISKEHKGHVDEVTGILKSSLRMGGGKSKRIGNTTISIGAAESRNTPAVQEVNPTLEAKTIKHLPEICRK